MFNQGSEQQILQSTHLMVDSLWFNPSAVATTKIYDKSASIGGGGGGNLANYRNYILANELVQAQK